MGKIRYRHIPQPTFQMQDGAVGTDSFAFSYEAPGGGGGFPTPNEFFNSIETVGGQSGDGVGRTTLQFCDSFDRGYWAKEDEDHITDIVTKCCGWYMSIYGNIGDGSGGDFWGIDTGFNGVGGKECCATYGSVSGDQLNMGSHRFKDGAQTEIRLRWYKKFSATATIGGEKDLNLTKFAGDIAWANIQHNCGTGSAQTSSNPSVQIIHGGSTNCWTPNIDAITLARGKWYCFEIYIKLNSSGTTADGSYDLYITDCGTLGLSPVDDSGSPVSTPILRTRLTNVSFDRNQGDCETSPCKIEVTWFERWANPNSSGRAWLDCIWCVSGNNGGVLLGFVDPDLF